MNAYIQKIDLTNDKKVIVSGQLSRTNLKANLVEHVYVQEPKDGIWGYTLEVLPCSAFGANMMVPFSVEAPWAGNEHANGVRITQPALHPNEPDDEIIQLKVKSVKTFTTEQANLTALKGAFFDQPANQLVVDFTYSGGCFLHSFSLEWDGSSLESSPPQYHFNLVDLSEYDPCQAIVPIQLRFDIDTPGVQLDRPSVIHLRTAGNDRQIKIEIA